MKLDIRLRPNKQINGRSEKNVANTRAPTWLNLDEGHNLLQRDALIFKFSLKDMPHSASNDYIN